MVAITAASTRRSGRPTRRFDHGWREIAENAPAFVQRFVAP
jgi:hypothetical protein